jgi:hypothetical protein
MPSISTARSDLVTSFPAPADAPPIARETVSRVVVLAILAAVVWGALAQVRSQPLPGEVGPEAAAITPLD